MRSKVTQDLETIQLDSAWLDELKGEFELPYMHALKAFLREEKDKHKVIYPKGQEYFAALKKYSEKLNLK